MADQKRSESKDSTIANVIKNQLNKTNQSKNKRGNNMDSNNNSISENESELQANNLELQDGISDEDLKNNLIENFSNHPKKIELEEQREIIAKQIGVLDDDINKLLSELNSLNKTNKEGKIEKISQTELISKKAELTVMKNRKNKLQEELDVVERKLRKFMNEVRQIIERSNLRSRALLNSYHNRYFDDIKKAITKFINSMDSVSIDLLKGKLKKAKKDEKERVVLTFCGKAPKFLDSRISANQEFKKKYIKHFFEELNKIK